MQKNRVLDNVVVAARPERVPAKAAVRPLNTTSIVLAMLAISVCSALVGIVALNLVPGVRESLAGVRNAAAQRMGEYLFFIGTTHLSLLLLRQKKWIKAKLMFLAGILWVSFHAPLTRFVTNLGGDSFSEAQAFDVDEAVFWAQTLHEAITPNFSWKVLLCYLVAAVASYQALRVLLRRREVTTRHYSYIKFSLAATVIGVAVHHTVSEPIALFIKNTEVYTETRKNFTNPAPALAAGGGKVDMLVYIGESTSTMNMGIYGYPRDTTPALQKIRDSDPNLLVFDRVFSTHTHTSPSLLEALSFGIDGGDNYLPIHKRRRLSLVDLLESNRIGTTLVSNQGQTGTWNMASSIIFKHARAIYGSDTRKVGNNDDKVAKPWDDVFFHQKIGEAFQGKPAGARIAFFHSYSGHGGYFANIPAAYRHRVDERFAPARGVAIPFRERVEEYDAAIRYIDQSVARAVAFVRAAPRPMLLVYFADHGDAPFAGRAHDSSQFIHEMARVPFMVYFNDAARLRMPHTWEKYRALAASGNDATLAQLPSTLLDLLGLKIKASEGAKVIETPVIGEHATHPPIVVRETASGLSYVDINRQRTATAAPAVERSDHASRSYSATRNKTNSASRVCYRGVDSMATLVRSRLVADCIELAVAIGSDGRLSVSSLAGMDSGLSLDDVFEVAAANRMGVWIHAPDLRTRAPCDALARQLRRLRAPGNPVLVEFPAGAHANAADLAPCAASLVGTGVATSYYVPSTEAVSCAHALAGGRAFGARRSCIRLRNDVAAAHRSGLFTDIGFDYAGVRAMEGFREAGYFRWNTWHMPPGDYSGAASERFKMTILSVEDGQEP
ncbi:MAG TPA: sulfatase-like hydrolase/transferase [Telluria sp.]|nr:sulfatase-like hydrolase/transferase [Telluria sp.]